MNKLLVVVDMQNDFVSGALGTPEAKEIVPKVADVIRHADEDTLILFTKDTHTEDYLNTSEGKNLPVSHCIEGTSGWMLVNEMLSAYGEVFTKVKRLHNIAPHYEEVPYNVILKPTFGSVELQNILYDINDIEPIENITFVGLCTGICVLSNAILAKATLPEVEIRVLKDCCACISPESHTTALEAMKLCQIEVV